MSRTKPPCTSVHPPGTAEHQQQAELLTVQEKREALIAPLTAKLQALWSKGTIAFTSDEIHLLRLMSTLVRLSDLDTLQTLSTAYKAMPPEWWDL
jgi:hypothetical protein